MVQSAIEGKDFWAHIYIYIAYKNSFMGEIDFEDQYDKADPIDDANLDEMINGVSRSL